MFQSEPVKMVFRVVESWNRFGPQEEIRILDASLGTVVITQLGWLSFALTNSLRSNSERNRMNIGARRRESHVFSSVTYVDRGRSALTSPVKAGG